MLSRIWPQHWALAGPMWRSADVAALFRKRNARGRHLSTFRRVVAIGPWPLYAARYRPGHVDKNPLTRPQPNLKETPMATEGIRCRHLVLGSEAGGIAAGLVRIGCAQPATPVLYDRRQHTYLTALTTCPDCLAVHAAWHVAFVASLDT